MSLNIDAPFNPADPGDVLADTFRRLVVDAAVAHFKKSGDIKNDELMFIMIGTLTGLAGISISCFENTDENHTAVRDAIRTMANDAVDQARSILDLPPLFTKRVMHG